MKVAIDEVKILDTRSFEVHGYAVTGIKSKYHLKEFTARVPYEMGEALIEKVWQGKQFTYVDDKEFAYRSVNSYSQLPDNSRFFSHYAEELINDLPARQEREL